MKIVHTGDTQLHNMSAGGMNPETGLNRRFEDALKCFDFVIDHAIKIKADYFIHAGDVTENRDPDSITIEMFAARVKRITDAGIKLIIATGNHDADSAVGTTTSISYLKALGIKNVYIADKSVDVFEFPDEDQPVRFLCLPYLYKSQLNLKSHEEVSKYIVNKINDFHEEYSEDDGFLNICISHYTIDKMFEGLEVNEPVIPLESFEGFDYNAFGHIHQYHDYGEYNVTGGYAGSTYRCTFGEKEKKYFNAVDFQKGEIDKVEIPNREFIEITVDARDVGQRGIELFCVNKLKHMDIEGKFLKITIKSYEKFNLRPIYDHLKDRDIFHYLPVQFERVMTKGDARLKYEPSMSSVDVVKSYLSKQKMSDHMKTNILSESERAIIDVGI